MEEPQSDHINMPRDIYGIAHSRPYERDGDTAFRELVNMLLTGELFPGRNEEASISGNKITESRKMAPFDDNFYVEHIKDGILGASVIAVLLIFLILIIINKKPKSLKSDSSEQSNSSQSGLNTIIDVEGTHIIQNVDNKNSSGGVCDV